MATTMSPRRALGDLDTTRLNHLGNVKNRQNAITAALQNSAMDVKQSLSAPTKRSAPIDTFEDDFDSENVDPSIFNSPSKRSKAFDGTPNKKPSAFVLTPSKPSFSSTKFDTPLGQKRRALAAPITTHNTPIISSRGSPKHKRVGLLQSNRRKSSSPYTRVDPPSFRTSSKAAGLPFSIDAALSGTIPTYKPKPEVKTIEESMPSGWFFAIHEDTPEQEATNLMEHSANCLDISSDDDCETKARNLEKEVGKENVPPPDWVAPRAAVAAAGSPAADGVVMSAAKLRRMPKHADAMIEDRAPLGDLDAKDFYAEGLDEKSSVMVGGEKEKSKLSESASTKSFEFVMPAATPVGASKEDVVAPTEEVTEIAVFEDAAGVSC